MMSQRQIPQCSCESPEECEGDINCNKIPLEDRCQICFGGAARELPHEHGVTVECESGHQWELPKEGGGQ